MSERTYAYVNPELLVWARDSRGFSLTEAAQKLGLTDAELRAREIGEAHFTIPQLRKVATIYRRPMALFYLSAPPATKVVLPDFRRLPEAQGQKLSPELLLEIRRIQHKQKTAASLASFGESHDWTLIGSLPETNDFESAGAYIRELLGVNNVFPPSKRDAYSSEYTAFNFWRRAIESVGVLVFQVSGVEVDEMRAFSITEKPYPAIALNRKDGPNPRLFSLLHEFCHILTNTQGVCNLKDSQFPTAAEKLTIEAFCNFSAGAALVPMSSLRYHDVVTEHGRSEIWTDDELGNLAGVFRVSKEVILRRLLISKLTTASFYQQKRHEWSQLSPPPKREGEGPRETGVQKVLRMQPSSYVKMVLEAMQGDQITAADASDYLDMKLKHLAALQQELSSS